MAIKVGGTTVVDDSRQLSNIASVDATTVAALGAAGVGGGGGSFEFTASGAISAGDVVSLNSNGTVSTVGTYTANPAILSDTEVLTGSYGVRDAKMAIAANPTDGTFLLAYPNTSDSNYPYAVFGQVDSSTKEITWGTPKRLRTVNCDCEITITYDSTNDAYALITNESNYLLVLRITLGAGLTVQHTGTSDVESVYSSSREGVRSCFDPDTGKVITCYYSGGLGGSRIRAIDLSSSTPTVYSATDFYVGDWSERADMVYDTNVNRVVHIRGGNTYTGWRIYSVNPSTFALENEYSGTVGLDSGSNPRMVFIPDENKICIVGRYSPNPLKCVLGTVSTTGITFGSEQTVDSSTSISPNNLDVTYDESVSRLIFVYQDYPDLNVIQASISGTTITTGSILEMNPSNYSFQAGELEYLSNSKSVIHVSKEFTNNQAIGFSISSFASTNSTFLGIAEESISDTATGNITVIGGVNEAVTGLTTNTTYYANETGGLTATVGGYKVGRALSATKLLITEGNA